MDKIYEQVEVEKANSGSSGGWESDESAANKNKSAINLNLNVENMESGDSDVNKTPISPMTVVGTSVQEIKSNMIE